MADYYTKLSALLPLSREALDFLLRAEAVLEDEDRAVPADLGLTTEEREMLEDEGFRPSGADYEWIAREEAIWVHGDDADPGTVAELARMAIRRFRPDLHWGFEYTLDCSRPRTDAYGGGAVVVTASGTAWTTTGIWLRRRLEAAGREAMAAVIPQASGELRLRVEGDPPGSMTLESGVLTVRAGRYEVGIGRPETGVSVLIRACDGTVIARHELYDEDAGSWHEIGTETGG